MALLFIIIQYLWGNYVQTLLNFWIIAVSRIHAEIFGEHA